MQYEAKIRSIVKAFSWRTLATLTTAGIVFVFTGRLAMALSIGFIEVFAKMRLYFLTVYGIRGGVTTKPYTVNRISYTLNRTSLFYSGAS